MGHPHKKNDKVLAFVAIRNYHLYVTGTKFLNESFSGQLIGTRAGGNKPNGADTSTCPLSLFLVVKWLLLSLGCVSRMCLDVTRNMCCRMSVCGHPWLITINYIISYLVLSPCCVLRECHHSSYHQLNLFNVQVEGSEHHILVHSACPSSLSSTLEQANAHSPT